MYSTTVILQHAGKDATKAYSAVHDPSLLSETLSSTHLIGIIDPASSPAESDSEAQHPPPPPPLLGPASIRALASADHATPKPPLDTLISAHDFELVAEKTLSTKAWAFYSSAATDLITHRGNKSFLDRIWFRPRVLRDVRTVSTRCSIMGVESALPLYVAPAALAKMVHPSGEKGIAAACARNGIIQCVSDGVGGCWLSLCMRR